jgi:hypothetical protein
MKAINTPMEALKRALDFTGFLEKINKPLTPDLADSIVSKVVITDDQTPFFADSINNRDLWLVMLDSIDISNRRSGIYFNFRVLLEPISGRIMKVYSEISEENLDSMPQIPSSWASTRDLKSNKTEYLSVPIEIPNISFFDAIKSARPCNAKKAKTITGLYVMYSRFGETPKPVWCITCRGIPPISLTSRSKDVPTSLRNAVQCIVDATTGDHLRMTSAPPSFLDEIYEE